MAETFPTFEFEQPDDRFQVDVSMTTMFALGEYMEDRRVGLTQAIHDLASIGIFVTVNAADGHEIKAVYPPTRDNEEYKSYEAPEIRESLLSIKHLDVPLDAPTHHSIDFLSDEAGIDKSEMFARLVEEARKIRVAHKMGAKFVLLRSDGKWGQVHLERED